jgi:hypothetical protein
MYFVSIISFLALSCLFIFVFFELRKTLKKEEDKSQIWGKLDINTKK